MHLRVYSEQSSRTVIKQEGNVKEPLEMDKQYTQYLWETFDFIIKISFSFVHFTFAYLVKYYIMRVNLYTFPMTVIDICLYEAGKAGFDCFTESVVYEFS